MFSWSRIINDSYYQEMSSKLNKPFLVLIFNAFETIKPDDYSEIWEQKPFKEKPDQVKAWGHKLKTLVEDVKWKTTSTATRTIVDWSSFCREICINWRLQNSKKIGGVGKIVELDEAKFSKRKYNRGRVIEGKWVFGGFERETKNIFFDTSGGSFS